MTNQLEAPESTRSFAGNEIRANYEVWLTALRELLALLPQSEPYLHETFNVRETTNPREIFAHVILAAYRHFNWIASQLGVSFTPYDTKGTLARLNNVESIDAFLQEYEVLANWAYHTVQSIEEDSLSIPPAQVWWPDWYTPVGMFEHTTVHVLRHIRQLKRMLAEKNS